MGKENKNKKSLYEKDEATRKSEATDITPEDMDDLENSEEGLTSVESKSDALPDEEDKDGTPLNEGPNQDDLFDTGSDLDVSTDDLFPDNDIIERED